MRGAGADQISVMVRTMIESKVSKKMPKIHAISEAVPVTPGMQIVEVSASATPENYSEVAAAVSSLCEFLAP